MADPSDDMKSEKDTDSLRKSSRIQKSVGRDSKTNNIISGIKKFEKRKRSSSDFGKEKSIEKNKKRNDKTSGSKSPEKVKNKTDYSNKKIVKKANNYIKQEKITSEEDEGDEEEEEDDEDEDTEDDKKSRKSSESTEAKFGPAMLGLHRIGDELPKKEKKEPVQLNRRGMPQRIRKKNRFFYDENVINPLMPKQRSKKDIMLKKKEKGNLNKIKHKFKTEKKEEVEEKPVMTINDRKSGQRIGMKLRNLLKLPKAHRWVCHEWFYSNIDKVLFQGNNDFMICFQESFPHLKTSLLTRVEWCKVRRMLGKPRRCSQAFLDEERAELERKRAKIRLLQQRKLSDLTLCKDLPDKVPLQLTVGSKVTARLRKPQDGLFTGTVDAVDTSNNTYRITFERHGLGTHSVPDYEVLSSEEPDFFSLSTFTRRYHNQPRYVQPAPAPRPGVDLKPFMTHKVNIKNLSHNSKIGKFPLKLLEMTVRLSKILGVKRTMVEKLKEMNTDAERTLSYGEEYTDDFQRRYASLVIELEMLNKNLERYLTGVQKFCHEIAPEPSMTALLAPSYLREKSREEARSLVDKHTSLTPEKGPLSDKVLLELIVNLIAVMIQVKSLSDSDQNAHELTVLQQSLAQIKSNLSPSNYTCFQDNVEVHMQFMQNGLGQFGTFAPFLTQKNKW